MQLPISVIEEDGIQMLSTAGLRVEYFSIRRMEDLAEPEAEDTRFCILIAAWLGLARLIDNITIDLETP